jgi:hypothetical protein
VVSTVAPSCALDAVLTVPDTAGRLEEDELLELVAEPVP